MESPLLDKLKCRWPTDRWRGLTMVVGCSGGADSTALLLAVCQLKPADTTVVAAHFNHQLRGLESDADELFVAELAQELGCGFVRSSPEERSKAAGNQGQAEMQKLPSEAWLREHRYAFLHDVAVNHGARYVVVGHTADDGVETTLFNLVRGTGLAGLTGISPFRDLPSELVLARPLTDVWRREILDYLTLRGQAFRQDSSNSSLAYMRNRVRHRWLPMLDEDFGAEARQAIHRSSTILADLQAYLEMQARDWLDRHTLDRRLHRVELEVKRPIGVEWPVIQHALTTLWQQQAWPLMPMTHRHWNELRELLQSASADSKTVELPSRIRVRQTGERWVIEIGKES